MGQIFAKQIEQQRLNNSVHAGLALLATVYPREGYKSSYPRNALLRYPAAGISNTIERLSAW